MPLPAAYDEATLAAYQIVTLGPVATALGWTATTPQVLEAVNDALVGYFGGVGQVADATDVPKLRVLARVAIWRAVARATAGHYRFGADQMTFDRQQVHAQAVAMIGEAEREAAALGVGTQVLVVTAVVRDSDSDPYSAHPSQWGGVAV